LISSSWLCWMVKRRPNDV